MNSSLKNLFGLFYPKKCLACAKVLIKYEEILCFSCKIDLPLTNFTSIGENETEKIFYGRIPLESATSLLHFSKRGKVQKLIHNLKYKNQQELGNFFGELLGDELLLSGRFNSIDCIIPVPLHKKKIKKRGYNQVTTFGNRLSQKLSIPYYENILVKNVMIKTQTFKTRSDRSKNIKNLFELNDIELLQGKHILLIDDVVTTGATLEACWLVLNQTKKIKISIATMAITD